MKKKIAIFGSTGSIGKNLIEIIKRNKNDFEVILLTAHNNSDLLVKQAKLLNAQNIIITNKIKFDNLKSKKFNFKIYSNFKKLKKIFKKKIDYSMCSITGIEGLESTLKCIRHTKKIAIANKESLICAWNLIKKELKKNKTSFVPVDSEHFSIWCCLNMDKVTNNINNIFITASGGPFLDLPISKFKSIKVEDAVKHPNWKMGNKISIDSSTLMNKVFEVIEAKNIFDLSMDQIKILINRDSYLHAIVNFKSGYSKMIIHETDMKIPIFNSLNGSKKFPDLNKLNIEKLNQLNLRYPDNKRFPMLDILKIIPDKFSLFNTVIVSLNDILVDLFLKKFINYQDISNILFKILNNKKFNKYKTMKPNSINEIMKVRKFVQSEVKSNYFEY